MLNFVMLALMAGAGAKTQPPNIHDFTTLYDTYTAAVKSGSFAKVSPFFSRELRGKIKTPADQAEFMTMAKMLVPASYEPSFLTISDRGRKAELQAVLTLNVPPEVQKSENLPPTQHLEVILTFVQEQGQWKWDGPTLIGDPDQRARPKDLNMGTRADYRDSANTSLGGQILRVDKQGAGTVYVIRVLDEEIAAFVPKGIPQKEFVPGQIIQMQAAGHLTDKLKYWAEEISLYHE